MLGRLSSLGVGSFVGLGHSRAADRVAGAPDAFYAVSNLVANGAIGGRHLDEGLTWRVLLCLWAVGGEFQSPSMQDRKSRR